MSVKKNNNNLKKHVLSKFIKSDKISTKKTKQPPPPPKNEQTKKVNKQEVATKRSYNQSNYY